MGVVRRWLCTSFGVESFYTCTHKENDKANSSPNVDPYSLFLFFRSSAAKASLASLIRTVTKETRISSTRASNSTTAPNRSHFPVRCFSTFLNRPLLFHNSYINVSNMPQLNILPNKDDLIYVTWVTTDSKGRYERVPYKAILLSITPIRSNNSGTLVKAVLEYVPTDDFTKRNNAK